MLPLTINPARAWATLPLWIRMVLFTAVYVTLGLYLVHRGVDEGMVAMPGILMVGMMMRGGAGNAGAWIMAGVLGLIAVIVAIIAWTPQVEAIDQYALQFKAHCKQGSVEFFRVFNGAGTNGEGAVDYMRVATMVISETGAGSCSGLAVNSNVTAAVGTKWYAETGDLLHTATSATGTGLVFTPTFVAPKGVTVQYAALSLLIIGVMPILNTAGFLGVTGLSLFGMVRGVANVHYVIVGTILALIISIVAMQFGPTFIGAIDGIHTTVSTSRFSSIDMFRAIIELIVEFVPTVFTVGLLGIIAAVGVFGQAGANYTAGRMASRRGRAMA